MEIFDNNVFELNPDMLPNTVTTDLAKITIIEGFYKDFDKVSTEIEKLPITYTSYNCEDMLDARKAYACNMAGTDLPYLDNLGKEVSRIIHFRGSHISFDRKLLINCNQTLTDKYKTHVWNPHRDPKNVDIAILVFLNKEYNRGDGFATYQNNDDVVDYGGDRVWYDKKDFKLNNFVQGRPNRAVLFDPQLLHGAQITSDIFQDQLRYTQIIFCHLS